MTQFASSRMSPPSQDGPLDAAHLAHYERTGWLAARG